MDDSEAGEMSVCVPEIKLSNGTFSSIMGSRKPFCVVVCISATRETPVYNVACIYKQNKTNIRTSP